MPSMVAQSLGGALREALAPERSEERLRRLHHLISGHLDLLVDGPFDDRVAKAACEVALYCGQLADWAPNFDAGWRAATLRSLVERLRSRETLQRLLWAPAYAGAYGLSHALLARAGCADARWDAALRKVLTLPASSARAAASYERLEEAWCRALVGAPCSREDAEASLEVGAHSLFMTEADAYAYTHAVLYSTAFGRRPLSSRVSFAAIDTVDAGVVWSLARGDFDLLGEFLLCAVLIGDQPTSAAAVGLAAWASTLDEMGAVPDRATQQVHGGDSRREAFFGIYHANLVAGLLSACLIANAAWREGLAIPPRWPLRVRWTLPRCDDLLRAGENDRRPAAPQFAPAAWVRESAGQAAAAGVEKWAAGALEEIGPDLAIHKGFQDRDLGGVATGISAGARRQGPTTTWLLAVEWLATFDDCLCDLALYDGAGGSQLAWTVGVHLSEAADALRGWGARGQLPPLRQSAQDGPAGRDGVQTTASPGLR
jgi:hypothetical protein